MSYYNATHVKITSGQTVSAEADLRGQMLHSIQTPALLDATTLSFQMADVPGGTFTDVYHLSTLAATKTTISSVGTSKAIVLDASLLPQGIGNCVLKLVSNNGGGESADRDFVLLTRAL